MKRIDLRSDTVTLPGEAMRTAMAQAPVGDDVYGEDPTVRRLEALAAERVGKEAALFVPSGTMANQIAVRVHCRAGDVVLAGRGAHLLRYEAGAGAALWGVQIETVGEGGLFGAEDVRAAIPPDDPHYAPLRMVAVENTHNASGGRVWPLEQLRDVAAAARKAGLGLHLDGARLFNAVVATGESAAVLCEPFDTLSFCLSKGLGAPVGSLICGDRERIHEARRARKMLGGGMRQAGVLAAAGIFALERHVDRLNDDHAAARRLASGLRSLGYPVDAEPETNIVMFRAHSAGDFSKAARERNVLINPFDAARLRAVTHLDVSEEDVDDALKRIAEIEIQAL
jgi:threonine aldolase